jgi:hypothetical protein
MAAHLPSLLKSGHALCTWSSGGSRAVAATFSWRKHAVSLSFWGPLHPNYFKLLALSGKASSHYNLKLLYKAVRDAENTLLRRKFRLLIMIVCYLLCDSCVPESVVNAFKTHYHT